VLNKSIKSVQRLYQPISISFVLDSLEHSKIDKGAGVHKKLMSTEESFVNSQKKLPSLKIVDFFLSLHSIKLSFKIRIA
jgi:hypothetical protein